MGYSDVRGGQGRMHMGFTEDVDGGKGGCIWCFIAVLGVILRTADLIFFLETGISLCYPD